IVRAERLDLWKNVLRGFSAYETMLMGDPGLADEVWFCAASIPVRQQTSHHVRYEQECQANVERINARFARPGRPDVATLLEMPPSAGPTRTCALAAMDLADTVVVNSTYDGLNLVAKEALLVGQNAPLLLSVNAGVYEQLSPFVTALDPFDVD